MTYLAVPISAKDLEGAGRQIKAAAAAGAQMLELRVDYLENLGALAVERLVEQAKSLCPAVTVTCRDKQQGGARAWPTQQRVEALTTALGAGADFVDFEYENFRSAEIQEKILSALSDSAKGRLILSAHNFKTGSGDIRKLYRDILAVYPAAIPKLIYTPKHINDCFEAFDLLQSTSGKRIVFCMGQAGLISRLIAAKLGSLVTFASIDPQSATAPGQLTIEQFKGLYRYDAVDSDTQLYGVIGDPIAHSKSPAVHNACFAAAGMNKLYLPLHIEGSQNEFDRFMHNIMTRQWLGFRGLSVTIPHKQNAMDYVRTRRGYIEPLAQRIGAINTLLLSKGDKLSGYNTDYAGALDAITLTLGIKRTGLRELPVAVIGAGGVARAIVAGLTDVGANVKIYNRTFKKGENLAVEFGCLFAPLAELPALKAKLVINCTSIGMYPKTDQTPLPKECIRQGMVVFDTVYNPVETLLLKHAKECGAKTIDGLSMFINQACAQFNLFTGEHADPNQMRASVQGGLTR
jgi:3-dehydroquinate dehydratase/shikimate dehydrogenase